MNEPLALGTYYHIYSRGNNRENIFQEQRNYYYFMGLYAKYMVPVALTFAYCLLRNHFHFLIRTRTAQEQEAYWSEVPELERVVGAFQVREPSQHISNLLNAYTRSFNSAYGRTGALFQRPFGRVQVTSDAQFRRLVVYIHRNPEKHGFVTDFRNWPYSSYQTILTDKRTNLNREAVLSWFGNVQGFHQGHEFVEGGDAMGALVPEDDD
jgi:putative transposase